MSARPRHKRTFADLVFGGTHESRQRLRNIREKAERDAARAPLIATLQQIDNVATLAAVDAAASPFEQPDHPLNQIRTIARDAINQHGPH